MPLERRSCGWPLLPVVVSEVDYAAVCTVEGFPYPVIGDGIDNFGTKRGGYLCMRGRDLRVPLAVCGVQIMVHREPPHLFVTERIRIV